jgi:hypothetical protein
MKTEVLMGKTWKNIGKNMEKHGKTSENMGKHGKTSENMGNYTNTSRKI